MASDENISVADGSSPSEVAPLHSSFSGKSSPVPAAALHSSPADADHSSCNNTSGGTPCDAETFYKKSGCCLKVLVAMCHGIVVDDKPLIDMHESP